MSKKTPYPKQEKFSAYYAAQKSRESDSDMKKPTDKGSTIPEDKNMYDLYDELVEPTDKASSSMKEDTKSDGKQDTQDQESSAVDKSTEEIKVSFSADEDTLSEGNWPHLTGEQSASENLYSDMPW
ncbi:uncharacterized protein [Ptychodera flava]|uniref:uncharacterized protein n=1 Tax=Ptychodera flava TaxID=63121 RepID=UPI00396A8EBB